MIYKKVTEYYTPPDVISLNLPLTLRLFEYIKENPGLSDVQLHQMTETARKWMEVTPVLTMDVYQNIVSGTGPT